MPNFLLAFLGTMVLSVVCTLGVRKLALTLGVLDFPKSERKVHTQPIPLLGGLAIYISILIAVIGYSFFTDQLVTGYLLSKHVIGVMLGGLVLMVGGYLDDRYDLAPKFQILFPIIAVLVVLISGVGINALTNPFAGGTIHFDMLKWELFTFQGVPYYFSPLSDVLTIIWLMVMMYATKYLDGLDGLVSGVGLIAAVIMFFVAQDVTLQQDYIALFSIIVAGAFMGFLFFNFNPASIFLGEGGSLFTGFIIGVLAILSGSKIATALLVLGVPLFDMVWVIARRFIMRVPLTKGDKSHLHHRLLAIGFTQRGAVLLLYMMTLLFGVTALFLQTLYKLYVLGGLVVFMICFALLLVIGYNKKEIKHNEK